MCAVWSLAGSVVEFYHRDNFVLSLLSSEQELLKVVEQRDATMQGLQAELASLHEKAAADTLAALKEFQALHEVRCGAAHPFCLPDVMLLSA